MIYKDFVAEAAQKIMAAAIADKNADSLNNDNESLAEYARGSVVSSVIVIVSPPAHFITVTTLSP